MLAAAQIRCLIRERVRREVGGLLELLTLDGEGLPLSPAVRDPLARRALGALDRLDAKDRRDPFFCFLEGMTWRLMEHYQEAIPPLRVAAEAEPGDIRAWLALAWCYKRTDQLELAIEAMLEAREHEPREAIVHYNLACYCSLAGDLPQAVESLATAFELEPEYRDRVGDESDFDPIRHLRQFREVCSVVV